MFSHETDFVPVAGFMTGFIYEEFHPNHNYDISRRSEDFIKSWFKRKFNEYNLELADQWITDRGIIFRKEQVLDKLKNILNCYAGFENIQCKIVKVHSDINEDKESGLGYAEGQVKYEAILKKEGRLKFNGPFKLYLQMSQGWWSIFFAIWPGLEW